MAGRDFAQPWVQRALREGLGPTAALRVARAGGLRIQDSVWFKTYGSERNNIALQTQAHDLPLNRRPVADEIGKWDTVTRSGFAYRIKALLQDRETGALKTAMITYTSPNLISRGRAIQAGIEAFQDPEEKYPSNLVGAFTAGVFEMVPLVDDEGEF